MTHNPEFPTDAFADDEFPDGDELSGDFIEPTLEGLHEALDQFAQEQVLERDLLQLSDLNRERRQVLQDRWPELPEEVRVTVIERAIDVAEHNVLMHVDRLLLFALEDGSPQVRRFAVSGLAGSEDISVADALLDRFQFDTSEEVRVEAAVSLSGMAELLDPNTPSDRTRLDAIAGVLSGAARAPGESLQVRGAALESLPLFTQNSELSDLIGEFYLEDETGLRYSALIAMGNTGSSRWIPTLTTELAGRDNLLRVAAAESLGTIEDAAALPDLRRAAMHMDAQTRHASVDAIAEISGGQARKILTELLREGRNPEDEDVLLDALRKLDGNDFEPEDASF